MKNMKLKPLALSAAIALASVGVSLPAHAKLEANGDLTYEWPADGSKHYTPKILIVYAEGKSASTSYYTARTNMREYLQGLGYTVGYVYPSQLNRISDETLADVQSIFDLAYIIPTVKTDTGSDVDIQQDYPDNAMSDYGWERYKTYLETTRGGIVIMQESNNNDEDASALFPNINPGQPHIIERNLAVQNFVRDKITGLEFLNENNEYYIIEDWDDHYDTQYSTMQKPNPVTTIKLSVPGMYRGWGGTAGGDFFLWAVSDKDVYHGDGTIDRIRGSGVIFEGEQLSLLMEEGQDPDDVGTLMLAADIQLFSEPDNLPLLGNMVHRALLDIDQDGVPDFAENIDGTDIQDPTSFQDTDGGGVPDYFERDSTQYQAAVANTSGASVHTDASDDDVGAYYALLRDTDADGSPDAHEDIAGTDSDDYTSYPDADGDGVPDAQEFIDSHEDGVACTLVALDSCGYWSGWTGASLTNTPRPNTSTGSSHSLDELTGEGIAGTSFKDTDKGGVPDYVETLINQIYEDRKAAGESLVYTPMDINIADDDWYDSDGGGVPDAIEIIDGTEVTDPDDDDISKFPDDDDDGVPTIIEGMQQEYDCSMDPPAPFEPAVASDPGNSLSFQDQDCGGIADYIELQINNQLTEAGKTELMDITNPADDMVLDTDEGGIPDSFEFIERTDFLDPKDDTSENFPDEDGDGVPDILEPMQPVFDCTDPENPVLTTEASDPSDPNSFRDADCGGMSDYREGQLNGLLGAGTYDIFDPSDDFQLSAPEDDSDGDGVPDVIEELDGTDPEDPTAPEYLDTDGGGMANYLEDQLTSKCTWAKVENPEAECTEMDITNPDDDYADSDGDGIPDGLEIIEGTDPYDPDSVDGTDTDGDGVPDSQEVIDGTDENDEDDFKDTDGGGESDFSEIMSGKDKSSPGDDFRPAVIVEADDTLLIGDKTGSLSIHWLLLLVGAGFIRLSNKRGSKDV